MKRQLITRITAIMLIFVFVLSQTASAIGETVYYVKGKNDKTYETKISLAKTYNITFNENPKRNITEKEFAEFLHRAYLEYSWRPSAFIARNEQERPNLFLNMNDRIKEFDQKFKADNYSDSKLTRLKMAEILYNFSQSVEFKLEDYVRKEPEFTDVDNYYINLAYKFNLMNGVSSTEFNPNGNVSLETLLYVAENVIKAFTFTNEFDAAVKKFISTDFINAFKQTFKISATNVWNQGKISITDVSKKYTPTSKSKDLTKKYNMTYYTDPTRPIFKGEALLLLSRIYQEHAERILPNDLYKVYGVDHTMTTFKDTSSLSEKILKDLKVMDYRNLMLNHNGYADLNKQLTRAEFASLIYNWYLNTFGIYNIQMTRTVPNFYDTYEISSGAQICNAYKNCLINSDSDDYFRCYDLMTIEELVDTAFQLIEATRDKFADYYTQVVERDVKRSLAYTLEVKFD